MTTREQARQHAQKIYDLANLIRNAVDAGIYDSAKQKLDLLAHEMAKLSDALQRLRLIEERPPGYEHSETQE